MASLLHEMPEHLLHYLSDTHLSIVTHINMAISITMIMIIRTTITNHINNMSTTTIMITLIIQIFIYVNGMIILNPGQNLKTL